MSSSPFHNTSSVFPISLKTEPSLSVAITHYDIYFLQSQLFAEFRGSFVSPKDTYAAPV